LKETEAQLNHVVSSWCKSDPKTLPANLRKVHELFCLFFAHALGGAAPLHGGAGARPTMSARLQRVPDQRVRAPMPRAYSCTCAHVLRKVHELVFVVLPKGFKGRSGGTEGSLRLRGKTLIRALTEAVLSTRGSTQEAHPAPHERALPLRTPGDYQKLAVRGWLQPAVAGVAAGPSLWHEEPQICCLYIQASPAHTHTHT